MNELILTEINLLVPLWILLIGLTVIVSVDPYIRREKRRLLLIGITMTAVLLVFECLAFYTKGISQSILGRTAADFSTYALRPAIIVIFCCIVNTKLKHTFAWIVVAVNAVIFSTALFGSHLAFWIGEDNGFNRGPLGWTSHAAAFVLIVYFLFISFRDFHSIKRREVLIPIFCALLVTVASILDSFGGELRFLQLPLIYPAIVGSCLFLYVWLHMQFAREHEKDMLSEQRVRLMVSQVKPHFIYNSLTVIKSYLDEPEKADEALSNFAGFLRGSIDLIDTEECIYLKKEMETVDHFLYLEKERFGDKLIVEEELKDTEFKLPAFTVQSLVENAISHGIRKKEDGKGTLVIKSRKTDEAHIIEVRDDGVGFDTEADLSHDDHRHTGLATARERLKLMCDGELLVESRPGRGTIVLVKIPVK